MIGNTNAQAKFVTLDTTQRITGTKTFTKNVTLYNPDKTESADGERVRISMGTSTNLNCPSIISTRMGGVVNRAYFRVTNKTSNKDADFVINATDSGDCYTVSPTRTYNSSNTSDVVTIGSLQASTDVVHSTGVETIYGSKTFTGTVNLPSLELIYTTPYIDFHHDNTITDYTTRIINSDDGVLRLTVKNDAITKTAEIKLYADGYVTASYRTYSASNTDDIVTIGSLQASTDVVHTAGNESIAGNKVFTSTIKVKDTGLPTYTSLPSSTRTIFYGFCANDNTTLGLVANFTQVSGNRCTYLSAVNTGNTIHRLNLWANVDGSAYVEGPSPTPATNAYRNITISTSEPTSADGNNGDIWIQY